MTIDYCQQRRPNIANALWWLGICIIFGVLTMLLRHVELPVVIGNSATLTMLGRFAPWISCWIVAIVCGIQSLRRIIR